jgi:SNF2 family DNA or RNA helicase
VVQPAQNAAMNARIKANLDQQQELGIQLQASQRIILSFQQRLNEIVKNLTSWRSRLREHPQFAQAQIKKLTQEEQQARQMIQDQVGRQAVIQRRLRQYETEYAVLRRQLANVSAGPASSDPSIFGNKILAQLVAGTGDDSDDGFEEPVEDIPDEEVQKRLESLFETFNVDIPKEERVDTPECMRHITLKEYQRIGVSWMVRMENGNTRGGILSDESMRL